MEIEGLWDGDCGVPTPQRGRWADFQYKTALVRSFPPSSTFFRHTLSTSLPEILHNGHRVLSPAKIWRDAPAVALTRWISQAQSYVVVAASRPLPQTPQTILPRPSRKAHQARRAKSVGLVTFASRARQNAVVISRVPSVWPRGEIVCITPSIREDVLPLPRRVLWRLLLRSRLGALCRARMAMDRSELWH